MIYFPINSIIFIPYVNIMIKINIIPKFFFPFFQFSLSISRLQRFRTAARNDARPRDPSSLHDLIPLRRIPVQFSGQPVLFSPHYFCQLCQHYHAALIVSAEFPSKPIYFSLAAPGRVHLLQAYAALHHPAAL